MLRDALLPMTLDIEHFMKVRLLSAAEDNGEDGYAVLRDYLKSLPRTQLDLVNGELDRRRNDPYVGAAVRKYRTDMPIWVFCEVMPFGMFSGLVKFCADRWNDPELRKIHYLLKNARSVRNFCAHGACSVNGLLRSGAGARPPAVLVNELTSAGIPKRLRSKWLRGSAWSTRARRSIYTIRSCPRGPPGRSARRRSNRCSTRWRAVGFLRRTRRSRRFFS